MVFRTGFWDVSQCYQQRPFQKLSLSTKSSALWLFWLSCYYAVFPVTYKLRTYWNKYKEPILSVLWQCIFKVAAYFAEKVIWGGHACALTCLQLQRKCFEKKLALRLAYWQFIFPSSACFRGLKSQSRPPLTAWIKWPRVTLDKHQKLSFCTSRWALSYMTYLLSLQLPWWWNEIFTYFYVVL